jgi:hypothetical protein
MQEKQTTQAERDALMITCKEEVAEKVEEEKTEEAAA